ncbi:hypothetical protein AB833_21830 [Chromatiales bacterium (ex Bugula neritina AB1)]|nr:hypothetical protein AB833_21830 [Chromatiales bacterium (ex Bugula neritina AB1)]
MKAIDAAQTHNDSAKPATASSSKSSGNNSTGFSDALIELLMANKGITEQVGELSASITSDTSGKKLAELVQDAQVNGDGLSSPARDIAALSALIGGDIAKAAPTNAPLPEVELTNTDHPETTDPTALLNLMASLVTNPGTQSATEESVNVSVPVVSKNAPVESSLTSKQQIVASRSGGNTQINPVAGTALHPTNISAVQAAVTQTDSEATAAAAQPTAATAQPTAPTAPIVTQAPSVLTQEARRFIPGALPTATAGTIPSGSTHTNGAIDSDTLQPAAAIVDKDVATVINQTVEKLAANAESIQTAITSAKANLLQNKTAHTTEGTQASAIDSPKAAFHQLTNLNDLTRPDTGISSTRATAPGAAMMNNGTASGDITMSAARNVQWMLDQGVSRATLQLHPAELGSLKINLNVQEEQLSIQITANQSATRETLEMSLPRLREQLTQQGFQDVNIDLGKQGDGTQTGAENPDSHHNRNNDAGDTDNAFNSAQQNHQSQVTDSTSPQQRQGAGLVDMFA